MMSNKSQEKDWKLFRSRLPAWQESYMDRLNHQYIQLLSSEGKPSEKFWALDQRIREDQKSVGVQVYIRRSQVKPILLRLLSEGVITLSDLEGFSDELRQDLSDDMETWKEQEMNDGIDGDEDLQP